MCKKYDMVNNLISKKKSFQHFSLLYGYGRALMLILEYRGLGHGEMKMGQQLVLCCLFSGK